MEQAKLPQVSITVVQDPADEAFSPDNLKVRSHMPRPACLSQKPVPTVILGALVHWLMRNNLLKKKNGYSIEQCSKDFSCSKMILKRVISGKKQKGGREYKREAEARGHADAPPAEEERPEQPAAPAAEDAPAADPDEEIVIDLQELVCKLCEEEYTPEEVLINDYTMQHPQRVQNILCRYCYELIQGYSNYLEHVNEHVAGSCMCLLCTKVCRTLKKLRKHMEKSHPIAGKDDNPGDQAEAAPKDTGEDTTQQEQVTGDQSEPPPQTPQPPPAATGAPTPGTPEEEKEKKGQREASEKYKVVCEACNRYFQDAYTRSGHINAYHKEILKMCGFCKSGFMYPWDYNKHLDATHVWCDDCHKFVKDRASFNKHFREVHGEQGEENPPPQQQGPQPLSADTGTVMATEATSAESCQSTGLGMATQVTSAKSRQSTGSGMATQVTSAKSRQSTGLGTVTQATSAEDCFHCFFLCTCIYNLNTVSCTR